MIMINLYHDNKIIDMKTMTISIMHYLLLLIISITQKCIAQRCKNSGFAIMRERAHYKYIYFHVIESNISFTTISTDYYPNNNIMKVYYVE